MALSIGSFLPISSPIVAEAPRPHREQPPVGGPQDSVELGRPLDDIGYAKPLGQAPVPAQAQPQPRPEDQLRQPYFEDLTRGMNPAPSASQQKSIRAAIRSFRPDQLEAMKKQGVRLWIPSGKEQLPPELNPIAKSPLKAPAQYSPTPRVVQMRDTTSADWIRHELAHAWDDVRNDKTAVRLDDIKDQGKRHDALNKLKADKTPFLSNTDTKLPTHTEGKDGRRVDENLSIKQMFERYKGRTLKEDAFGTPKVKEGYTLKNPQEFYAEGFSVFHGPHELQQGRMLRDAPELFNHFEAEAVKGGAQPIDAARRKELLEMADRGY